MEIKSKIKKMALIIMSLFTMVLAVMGNVALIKAMEVDNEVEVTEWKQISDYHYLPVECTVGNVDVSYTYDENNYRTSKTVDGVVTTYVYEECVDANNKTVYRLISECRDCETINYYYDMLCVDKVVGFTYEDEFYGYLYDDYGNINGIEKDNIQLCSYSYTTDGRSTVNYDISNNNISGVNRLFFEVCYYDEETGYYYKNGNFNDLNKGIIINKKVVNNNGITLLSNSAEITFTKRIDDFYARYKSTAGAYKPYYGENYDWTSGLDEIELVARTIYGEFGFDVNNTDYTGDYQAQRAAVAWVIQNRVTSAGFPSTATEVVKQEEQFASITGSYDETNAARGPITNTEAWDEALRFAIIMYCGNNYSYTGYSKNGIISTKLNKPAGINNQKYFVAKGTWEDGYDSINGTFSFTKGNPRSVTDIAINVGNIHPDQLRNIFFNWK